MQYGPVCVGACWGVHAVHMDQCVGACLGCACSTHGPVCMWVHVGVCMQYIWTSVCGCMLGCACGTHGPVCVGAC